MRPVSTLATGVFLATVLAMAAALVYGMSRRRTRDGVTTVATDPSALAVALVVILVWLVPPAVAARAGVLDRYDSLPPPVFLMVATYAVFTIVLAFSPLGARLIAALGLAGIVGMQAFRIPVEWFLHRAYLEGAVPVQMTFAGWNFDIVSGVTGAALGVWMVSGRGLPRAALWAWNLLCLALLVNIVTIAILSHRCRSARS